MAQTNGCPFIPNKKVTFGNAEVPLYRSPNLDSPTVYTIKPNLAFKFLEQSGQKIDGLCWYKVELPLDQSIVWAGFKIGQKQTSKSSASPIPQKSRTTPKPSPDFTPTKSQINAQSNLKPKSANKPKQTKLNTNYSFYFYLFNIILGFFLLAFLLQIISSIMQQAKARKLKQLTDTTWKVI